MTCAAALLAVSTSPARATLPFTIEIVDPATPVAACPCIAMDPAGNPHVSFQSIKDRDLIYGASDGVSWTVERVDTTGDQGYCNSLALDSAGNPHIAYWDRTLMRLRYVWKSGGLWQRETIDSGWAGIYVALKLDAQGRPHVTYAQPLTFWYAERGSGGWVKTAIDASVQGYQSDLVLEPSGRVHIIYQDEFNGDLHYALKDGAQWFHELVDSEDVVGDACTLALDAAGTLHTAYFDWTNTRVRYATQTGTGWTVERTTGLEGGTPFVAIDPGGAPHIAFYRNDGHVGYASRETGDWTNQVIDPNNFNGPASALAYDPRGNPYVLYEHQTDRRLHLASTALHLHSPLGNELWSAGDAQVIRWRGAGDIEVQLSRDGGVTFPIRRVVHSDTSLVINAPFWSTRQARCRIERLSPYSISESGDFTIEMDVGPRFALGRAFPNPWRGIGLATFPLSVPTQATVTLELYDVQGRLVSHRPPATYPGGHLYAIEWDPGSIPSGLYFVRANSSSGESAQSKWVLSR